MERLHQSSLSTAFCLIFICRSIMHTSVKATGFSKLSHWFCFALLFFGLLLCSFFCHSGHSEMLCCAVFTVNAARALIKRNVSSGSWQLNSQSVCQWGVKTLCITNTTDMFQMQQEIYKCKEGTYICLTAVCRQTDVLEKEIRNLDSTPNIVVSYEKLFERLCEWLSDIWNRILSQ